jgi:hypothetical protein
VRLTGMEKLQPTSTISIMRTWFGPFMASHHCYAGFSLPSPSSLSEISWLLESTCTKYVCCGLSVRGLMLKLFSNRGISTEMTR